MPDEAVKMKCPHCNEIGTTKLRRQKGKMCLLILFWFIIFALYSILCAVIILIICALLCASREGGGFDNGGPGFLCCWIYMSRNDDSCAGDCISAVEPSVRYNHFCEHCKRKIGVSDEEV
mmetsp:Transcript_36254/g.35166  ORF Transcript_36254/g.35166 Transcript_36254/m.35166 type:complete len:120 (+) Transcript_36254:404-763(+)